MTDRRKIVRFERELWDIRREMKLAKAQLWEDYLRDTWRIYDVKPRYESREEYCSNCGGYHYKKDL